MNNPISKKMPLVLLTTMFLGLGSVEAQEIVVPVIEVEAKNQNSQSQIDGDALFKTEKVDAQKLEDSTRTSLFEVLQDQPGVDTQVYCANCGAKRLSINGLKAEHTSILVDGLPLHSAVSSFYGVDNIPTTALKDILVMRGTGASLTNPEAIGGTINLLTVDPLEFHNQFTLSAGVNDDQELQQSNQQFTFGYTDESKKFGIVFSGQYADIANWDEDENLVAELPERENYSAMVKSRVLLGSSNDLSARLSYSKLEILGGAANPTVPTDVPIQASEADFEDGNVEKKFIGNPAKITDWIETNRTEAAFSWRNYLNATETIDFKTGFARNEQKAIYQHGFDYANIDNLFIADLNYQKAFESGSLLKAGMFLKDQRLRSTSVTLFDDQGIPADSFDYWAIAAYASYSIFWENFELDLAMRIEKIDMNWLELSNRVNDQVFAPRLQLRHNINEHLTQRLSYGYGYRAPLTFFESQHGNNENGYQVNITELETAHSLVYSLSYNTPTGYATGGIHYTYLDNMAYGFETASNPIEYRNIIQGYHIVVSDLLLGYKPIEKWLIELGFEYFHYEDDYTLLLPSAAIEQRATLTSNFEYQKWTHNFQFILVPSRKLSRYGRYFDHFVDRNESSEPTLDPSLSKKKLVAPTFFTINTSIDYEIKHHSNLILKVENLLDYTQISDGDGPSTWHWHFDHAHYDGLHTWGPNAGRVITLSYNQKFH